MSSERNFPPEPVQRQRRPAGQALIVIAIAFLLGTLFNADKISRTAENQPIGSWQRTWAMRAIGPFREVSHALRLNKPREVLADKADNELPPPPKDTETVETVPRTTVPTTRPGQTTTSSTTTTIKPVEHRTPTDAEPLRILVTGDSLMGFIGPAMVDGLEGKPVKLQEDWKVGSGLARPDVINWPAKLEEDMRSDDPEIVVIGFGANDAQPMRTDSGSVQPGTKEWGDEYQRRVAQLLDEIKGKGRTVYWIGIPLTTRGNIEKAWPQMEAAIRTEIGARPWAHFIDTRPILSPDGNYTQYLPQDGGGQVKVREGDGVHPTLAGDKLIVAPIIEAMTKERKL